MRKRTKKWMCLLLTAAMAMSMSACGGSAEEVSEASQEAGGSQTQESGSAGVQAEEGTTTSKEDLVYAMSSDPGTVDPYSSMALNLRLSTQTVEGLVEYDENGELSPLLAKSWEYNDDNTELTLHLQENVTFTNGDPLTADDVVYSFSVAAQNPTYVGALSKIDMEAVEAIDENTVKVPLKGSCGTAINMLSSLFVVNKSTYEENHAVDIIGTGPFIIESYTAGDSIRYQANENYWGGAPAIKSLTIRFISEASVRMTELQNGTVDMIDSPLAEDVQKVKNGELEGISYQESVRSPKVQFVGINETSVPDLSVRQAILYAIDADAIYTGAYSGLGEKGHGVLPSGWWYSTEADGNLEYNPDKAKELLAEAGYDESNPLKVRVAYATNLSERVSAAEILYNQLTAVGIEVELVGSEGAICTDMLNSTDDYEIFLSNFGNLFEPGSCLTQKFSAENSTTGGSGWFRISGEAGTKITETLETALATSDETARAELYREIQNLIAEECVVKSFLEQKDYGLMNASLSGVWWQPNPSFKKAVFQ